jgi:hypothetical protein
MIAGSIWIRTARPPWIPVIATSAIALGFLKARFVLNRSARRVTDRIESRGDGRCIGGFLSWKTWLLVVAMILLGRLLRLSPLPRPILGLIYAAIGFALLAASRLLWARWRAVKAASISHQGSPPDRSGGA